MRFGNPRLRAAAFAAFLSIFVATTGTIAPVPAAHAATAASPASRVIALAKAQLGDPWVHYAVGPRAFDCSGLVYYVFRNTGYLSRIGGRRMSAYGYLAWGRQHGYASRYNPKPGDLVVWGGGSHVGIYIGAGKAISTLTSGVRIHGVYAVTARFTTYIHTRLSTATTATDTSVKSDGGTLHAVTNSLRRTTVNLRLRTGAGTGHSVIRVLHRGTRVTVLALSRDRMGRIWYRVQAPTGRLGWVASWFTRA